MLCKCRAGICKGGTKILQKHRKDFLATSYFLLFKSCRLEITIIIIIIIERCRCYHWIRWDYLSFELLKAPMFILGFQVKFSINQNLWMCINPLTWAAKSVMELEQKNYIWAIWMFCMISSCEKCIPFRTAVLPGNVMYPSLTPELGKVYPWNVPFNLWVLLYFHYD